MRRSFGIEVKPGVVHELPHRPVRRLDVGVAALEELWTLRWFAYLGAGSDHRLDGGVDLCWRVEELTQVEGRYPLAVADVPFQVSPAEQPDHAAGTGQEETNTRLAVIAPAMQPAVWAGR